MLRCARQECQIKPKNLTKKLYFSLIVDVKID
jgi:hypothetical protein